MSQTMPSAPPTFRLFEGGALSELQRAWRRTGSDEGHVGRTIALAVLVTWVPLLALAAIEGSAFGALATKPMLSDVAMYARFLVALPLLLLAPVASRDRLQRSVAHFREAGLVNRDGHERFVANIISTLRLRDSAWAALLVLVLAYAYAGCFVVFLLPDMPASWRTVGAGAHRDLSLAGWWFVLVSQPLWNFVVLRFAYRILLWWRFLWQTARLDLQLNAAHADKAGGLAFLGMTLAPFMVPVFAIAASMAGGLANLVLWTGASVSSYKFVILGLAVFLVIMFAGPLLFFAGPLSETKRRGILEYGVLSGRQLRVFERKWLGTGTDADAEVLNAPDFSALIDFQATVATVHEMTALPFQRMQIVPLLLAALAPFLPVAALEIPLRDILGQFLKIVM